MGYLMANNVFIYYLVITFCFSIYSNKKEYKNPSQILNKKQSSSDEINIALMEIKANVFSNVGFLNVT